VQGQDLASLAVEDVRQDTDQLVVTLRDKGRVSKGIDELSPARHLIGIVRCEKRFDPTVILLGRPSHLHGVGYRIWSTSASSVESPPDGLAERQH